MGAHATDRKTVKPNRTWAAVAWCFYDWANSAFPTVIVTFIFAAYFAKAVAQDLISGTAAWSGATATAGFLVAVLGPALGAIADKGGRRKPWLFVFTALCVVATACLWATRPDPADTLWALGWVVVAFVGFEMGGVFYNAMLPDLVASDRLGRWSGWAWGFGYVGGLACLVLALAIVASDAESWFGVATKDAGGARATALLAAGWMALFALPLFWLTPDFASQRLSAWAAARQGLASLGQSLRHLPKQGPMLRFLVAHMIYADGLATLFAFGGIYAAGTFALDTQDIILLGIAMNLAAGVGAFAFGWIDDALGAKRTIMLGLAGLMLFGLAAVLVDSKTGFWLAVVPLALFVGPVQAASRSFMARIAPPGGESKAFGLFALSGKATAFLGPMTLGWCATAFASQRAGMASILVFLAVGFVLLLGVGDSAPDHSKTGDNLSAR